MVVKEKKAKSRRGGKLKKQNFWPTPTETPELQQKTADSTE
jgi:hypothetical protein